MSLSRLMTGLKKILAAPEYADEEQARVAAILHFLLLVGLSMTLLFGVGGLFTSAQPLAAASYALGFGLAQLIAMGLLHSGRIRAASIITIGGVLLILTYGIAVAGGLNSIGLSAQFILVILAGLLLGGRQAILTAVICVLIDSGMLALELAGRLPPVLYVEKPASRMLSQTVDLLVVAILLYVTTRSLKEALDRARENERRMAHIASHDTLTKLPNRALFNDRLGHAIEKARRNDHRVAVLFLDLDNFKTVNDAFGHQYGDELLIKTAECLQGCARACDTLARMGGDEFVFLLEDLAHPETSALVAEKISYALSKPFHICDTEIFITASIGISIFPENGENAEILLQQADVAMYRAKALGKDNYQYYSESMAERALERVALASRLRHVVEDGELKIVYQPLINIGIGKVIAVEALLRWHHPEHGQISPIKFIPLAEETGQIISIGEWVMRRACEQNKTWLEQGFPAMRVAVNVSERQLQQPDFVDTIAHILEETGLPPELLELELTESIVFQNVSSMSSLLKELKALGIYLSMDDFGTGYSTLSQLARFPFDTLKIDRYFAQNVTRSVKEAAVVSGIIQIARSLGMAVIAEGVETMEQLEFYEGHGCNVIQGWFFSKALSPPLLEENILAKVSLPRGEGAAF